MRLRHYVSFLAFGAATILLKRKKPILATIILTDACNLSCKHCAVGNITRYMEPYENVRTEMQALFDEGTRILFFCGGETFLWNDSGKTVEDLVTEAKKIGFYLVVIVTNGLAKIDVPNADIIFVSIDGLRESHDSIRGPTFDAIIQNVRNSKTANVCVYMAINTLNYRDIRPLAELVRNENRLRSISFNFHTPYPGTEYLALTPEQKKEAVREISELIDDGYPVFNLKTGLSHYLSGTWDRPCFQCLVSERGKRFTCGRCVEIPGLCAECGYLFAVEFSLLFKGNIPAILEMLATYRRFA